MVHDHSIYKWKNQFYEMKGDVGMSLHEKERNKKIPTQDTKSLITPSLHLCFATYSSRINYAFYGSSEQLCACGYKRGVAGPNEMQQYGGREKPGRHPSRYTDSFTAKNTCTDNYGAL